MTSDESPACPAEGTVESPTEPIAHPSDDAEDEVQFGGGVEGLTVKFGLLAAELENTREGCHRLAVESEEVVQAIFERLGILHCRTSRIETALGLPPWQPPDSPSGEGAQSPRSPRVRPADGTEDGAEGEGKRGQPERKTCLRGHPLMQDAEGADGPPKQCGFCKCSRQTAFQCSGGCYFHACQDCVLGGGGGASPEDEEDLRKDAMAAAEEEKSDAPTKAPEGPGRSRSPSDVTEEDVSRAVAEPKAEAACSRPSSGRSRPVTPSTTLPEDCADASGRCDADSPEGMQDSLSWLPSPDASEIVAQDIEASRPPRPPRESSTHGMKARLCALEAEVRELAAAVGCSPAASLDLSSAALEAAVSAAKSATEASCAALQQELSREFCSKAELLNKVSQVESEIREKLGETTQALRQDLAATSQALRNELSQHETAPNDGFSETLKGFQSRLDALESELPRGRVRASRGTNRSLPASPTKASGMEIDSDGAVQGLARGLTALTKSLGLTHAGEQLGCADLGWDEVGPRIEEAWAARAKEAWHLGLPNRPDLFDFLQAVQSQATSRQSSGSTAGVPRLPDRREAARLANRLSSTSPSPVQFAPSLSLSGSGHGYDDGSIPCSPTRQQANDVDSSPMSRHHSASGGLGAGPRAAQSLPLPSHLHRRGQNRGGGRDAAEAWCESSQGSLSGQGRSSQRPHSSGASHRSAGSGKLPPRPE